MGRKKKLFLIKCGQNKYGREQYVHCYSDCNEWDISAVPSYLDRISVNNLYKRVVKEYDEKLKDEFFKRRNRDINFEIVEI